MHKKSKIYPLSIFATWSVLFGGFATPALRAAIAPFSTGNFSVIRLGDLLGTGMDRFSFTGVTNQLVPGLDISNPQTAVVGSVQFQTGHNCNSPCGINPTGNAVVDFTYNGVDQPLLIPYTVILNYFTVDSDKLRFYASHTLEFDLGNNQQLQVTSLPFNGILSAVGNIVTADLSAEFVVVDSSPQSTNPAPEPSARQLFLTGAGLFGAVVMLQKRRSGTN